MGTNIIDDPLSWMDEGGEPGDFVPDPRRPDYRWYVPRDDAEKSAIVQYLCDAIKEAEDTDGPRIERILENRRVYEAHPKKDEAIHLPIAKQDANQVAAGIVNAIMSKQPIVTIKPLEGGEMSLLVRDEFGEQELKVSTTQEAAALQEYGEYLLKRRVPFRDRVETAVLDMVSGGMPYLKICYEANYRTIREMKFEQGSAAAVEVRRSTPIDEPLKMEPIDGINILLPPGERDEQLSPWIAERYELSPTKIRQNFAQGLFVGDILNPEAKAEKEFIAKVVGGGAGSSSWQDAKRESAKIMGRATRQRSLPSFHEVWFYWPRPDENGEIELLHLCAQLQLDCRELLALYDHPYRHGLRPLIPLLQRPKPYEWASGSTVDDIAPIQKMMSKLFDITIKNGIQAIIKGYLVKKGSPGWHSMLDLEKANALKPGCIVGVGDMGEITPFQMGGNMGSLSSEIGYLDQQRRGLSVVPEHQNIPNRTASGTVSQIMAESKAQGSQTLERVREQLGKAIKMLFQVAQQFSYYGEPVPFEDPKTRAIVEKFIYFPTELIDSQFSFDITATADDDTNEAKKEAEMLALRLINEQNQTSMTSIFEMMSPETPPFYEEVLKQAALRSERQLGRLLALSTKDSETFVWDEEELGAMLTAKHEFLEKQKAEEAAAAEQQEQSAEEQPAAPAEGEMPPMPPEGAMPPGMEGMNGPIPPDLMAPNGGGALPPNPMQPGGLPPMPGQPMVPEPGAELPPGILEALLAGGGI